MRENGWRSDVALAESLRVRIKQHEGDPKMKAVYETALRQLLASNSHLALKGELEHLATIIPRALGAAAVETDR